MNRFLPPALAWLLPVIAMSAPNTPVDKKAAPHAEHDHSHDHAHGHAHEGNNGNPANMDEYIKALDNPERDAWQQPDAVVTALGLKPGQVACDVGAGSGYFSLRLARAVGAQGQVFAVDVEPRMSELLRTRIAEAHLTNVTPVLGAFDRPLLPRAACDVVLLVNVYHHIEKRGAYLALLKDVLRPGGTVVNVDFEKRETGMGPPLAMRVAKEDFLKEATAAGLVLRREETFLPHQYMLVLAPR